MSATKVELSGEQMMAFGQSAYALVRGFITDMSAEQRRVFADWMIAAGRKLLTDNGGVDPVKALEDELAAVKAGLSER